MVWNQMYWLRICFGAAWANLVIITLKESVSINSFENAFKSHFLFKNLVLIRELVHTQLQLLDLINPFADLLI